MTDHLARLRNSPRAHVPLAATMLVVALSALGCSTAEPSARTPAGLPPARAAGGLGADDDGRPIDGGPFDVGRPEIGNLDPDLLEALRAAARDAQRDGVSMEVTSGWRSRAHQERLFAEGVATYGSEEDARRYVATPDTSAHVTGDAVDIGPTDADSWLSQHGSDYGLCQVFANEIWHYELATSPGAQCPDQLPDGSSRS